MFFLHDKRIDESALTYDYAYVMVKGNDNLSDRVKVALSDGTIATYTLSSSGSSFLVALKIAASCSLSCCCLSGSSSTSILSVIDPTRTR